MGGQSNPGGASARRSGRGADGGTRTPTGRSPPGPKPGAYSNSATSARPGRLWRHPGGWARCVSYSDVSYPTPPANYTSPPGAVAQLVVASVSKTEGPRF